MYFKGLAIAAGIAVAITGQAATAADLPARAYPAPVAVAPVYNWTGFYVGGGFGYGLYDVETSTFAPGFDNAFNNGDTGGRGWLGRVQVGYDYQFASWVVGVFADYDWSNIRGTVADHNSSNNFDLKQSSAWAVGGRIGYVVVPQLLAFTTIGYTEARFQGSTGTCVFSSGCGVIGTLPDHTFSGWFIGGGAEYAFSWLGPGWTWKTEYRLSEFSRDTFALTTTPAVAGAEVTMKPFVQTVVSQITYKFNWGR
jgi:outer membrane immunogenic protein